MRTRSGIVALVALLAAGSFPAVPVEAALATPASFTFELVDHWFDGSRATLREVAWHPSGDYALIAGGIPGPSTDPMNGYSLLLRYEAATGAVTPVVNESGRPMLFNVEFHPSGSHALAIGEKDTVLRYDHATGAVENVWADLQAQYLAQGDGTEAPVFLIYGLAYRPDGAYALLSGSSLIAYRDEDRHFQVIDPGDKRFYKSIGFAPDSSYAVVEGGDTDEEGHARIGQLWLLGLTEERCARYYDDGRASCMPKFRLPYGLFQPDRAEPADITFHPIINASFVYGYDDTHGTMMRIRDNGTDYVPEWMQANHEAGKYTDMDFRPNGTRALVTAFGEPQLLEFDGLQVRPLLNATICRESMGIERCPELQSVDWHPSGDWALAVGGAAKMLEITPRPEPEVVVLGPKDHETIVDEGQTTVVVQGTALASQGNRIATVDVRVDDGDWEPANVFANFNPANWRFDWNASMAEPGPHTFTVRATDTVGHVSSEVALTVHVALPPPPLEVPVLETTNFTSRLGNFTFAWAPVDGASHYEVQDSKDPDFGVKVTWPVDGTTFESFSRDNGTHYFRVRAVGEPRPASEWSETLVVTVTEGRRVEAPTTDDDDVPPSPDTPLPDLSPNEDGNVTPPPEDDEDPPVDDGEDPDATADVNDAPGPAILAVLLGAALAVAFRRRSA